jgi:regulator of sirC expression with transglutaminase-like and TPR domain
MPSHDAIAEYFAALVGQQVEDDKIDLLCAALAIARLEYPALEVKPYIAKVDALAARVAARSAELADAAEPDDSDVIGALNEVLFEEEGLRGNTDDYYDPRNSFVNDVLDRKLGIPITLALIYMEVARRVGFPLFGIGMPDTSCSSITTPKAGSLSSIPSTRDNCSRRRIARSVSTRSTVAACNWRRKCWSPSRVAGSWCACSPT